ncbi:putative DNA binding domain-containing protein [candidate division TA06 bacterium]|uniref:DNA binding domain-containing protein n=1 Tax=candidate division TA06 bacterium TaxID=2250710 RepID=A0A933MKS1_UNCT6|nr:putative DNA binding domain-containing protein [candidate division TA06 bacterium]
MLERKIRELIKQGEGLRVEFKECKSALSKDVYETVSAFLNRSGGELLLGVKDNGVISGVDKDRVEQIKKDFATGINNPQKINPSYYLTAEEAVIDGKTVIYIFVPESSQVHRCNGKIFDRNEDGDFNITDNSTLVTALYIRKQTSYTENNIYPFVAIGDLRKDLIVRARKLAVNQKPDHIWSDLDDLEMIKSAQLYKKAKIIIPITPQAAPQVTRHAAMQDTTQVAMQDDRIKLILKYCQTPRTRTEIQKHIKITNREYFRKDILNPLINQDLLHPTIPGKPRSPKQKYYSVKQGDSE